MLCMIVRNESQIIERCLAAALPIVDAACICDTGSDDDTVEIARTVLEGAGTPARIPSHEWVNFGVNRTRSFGEAREFARELGWTLADSYALFIDADMILHVAPDFQKDSLTASGYSVTQIQGTLRYDNLRLARLDEDWICAGATHEFWALPDTGGAVESLNGLSILDVGDGGSKEDKFERDIRLLEEELEADPDNPRTIFYLAQSYFDTGQYERARDLYQRRSEMGGWEEERWYAAYRAALSTAHLGDGDRGLGELFRAWGRRPERAEPLADIARYARTTEQHALAILAAERALALDPPADDKLFVDLRAYDEAAIEELSISAFYGGSRQRGLAACDALVHRYGTAEATRDHAASNVAFYADPIANYDDAVRVDIPASSWDRSFSASVGSIHKTRRGYRMINRLVNYYHEGGTSFYTRDASGHYISKNVVVEFDRELRPRRFDLVDDQVIQERAMRPATEAQIVGVEDVRLFRWQDQWWFVGNSTQFTPAGHFAVLLGQFNRSCSKIVSVVRLRYGQQERQEKSWLPLVHQGELYLLYLSNPTIVLRPDTETGECEAVATAPSTADLSRYRGSSPFVPFNGRLLAVVHEVSWVSERRVYLHRFIILDPETWTITHASHPFTFLHDGVEYCCGLTWAHEPTELLISFSFEERESWITRIDRERVREMLRPVEDLARIDPLPGLAGD